MTADEIRAAIIAHGWKDKSPGEIAELLNEPRDVIGERYIGVGTVMDVLGPAAGASILAQFESQKDADPVVKYGWFLLERERLDVGLPSTRAMLDALLPSEAADVLKGLAVRQESAGVSWQRVAEAMEAL